jgi:peroxiredoxin
MTITVNSIIKHRNASKNVQADSSDTVNSLSLKEIFKKELEKKGEYNDSNIHWIDDETVEVTNVSGLAIHSFALRAEEMGQRYHLSQKKHFKDHRLGQYC